MGPSVAGNSAHRARFGVLDGWRGISITLVLCGHLLPLGPKQYRMNETIAATGMVLFFTLSGFLITNFLIHQKSVPAFLIRRFFRIVPLAWLYCAIVLVINAAEAGTWLAHTFFYANLPPFWLLDSTPHIWSLCVETQFYVGIALVVSFFGSRGMLLLPFACVAVTAARIAAGAEISIVTWFRVDEILAGCCLALLVHRAPQLRGGFFGWPTSAALAVLLVASAHPASDALNYLRPYLSAMLVGTTLFNGNTRLGRLLKGRALSYLAGISYALYVLHPGLAATWLGEGERWTRYAKRPLLFLVLLVLADLSTRHFESRFIEIGRQWSGRRQLRSAS